MDYRYDVMISAAHIKQLRMDYNKAARLNNLPTLGQAEIAEKLGVTREHYCLIENGKSPVSIERLVKICAFYDVSADYVLGFANNKYNISDGIIEARIHEIERKLEESRKKILDDSSALFKQRLASYRQELMNLSTEINALLDVDKVTGKKQEQK